MIKAAILFWGLMLSFSAFGELTSFRMDAKVLSFDKDTVVCQLDQGRAKIPRSAVVQKKFKDGDVVQINLEGEQIKKALATLRRVPASK